MIIYSCITNGYDEISDDHYYDPNVKYVMFHDGTIEKKGPWEFIELNVDETCPVRKSYHPKHLPHHYFETGEDTVWIDGCYKLTKNFTEISKSMGEFVLQIHPAKRSLIQEFLKLYSFGFSSEEECYSLASRMYNSGYRCVMYKQTINCCVWRKISPEINAWNECWRDWYMSSRDRDQICSAIAEFQTIRAKRCSVQISLDQTHRVKDYTLSYNIDTQYKNTDKFIDNLCKIFNVNRKLMI
jgi:hypothetical protein